MGSTGEPDRKRRQVSSLSPTAASAKKQHFLPISEDKKLDITVLQYRNQKLIQKLETQRVEYSALENKFLKQKEKHQPYGSTLKVVHRSWDELAHDLESCSISTRKTNCQQDADYKASDEDGSRSTFHDAFLKRLTETGATECSSICNLPNQQNYSEMSYKKAKSSLSNLVAAIDDLCYQNGGLHGGVLKKLSEYGSCKQQIESEIFREVKSLRIAFTDAFLLHMPLSKELQSNQDIDAKNKAGNRRLRGELQNTIAELEESHCKLATLKAQRDAVKGAGFPILNHGSKHASGDKIRDKLKDLQDMESALKDLMDQASCQLMEIKGLHEERIRILQRLSGLQTQLKNVACISSSQAFLLVKEQIEKLKAEVVVYQASYEKLQAEKDNLVWKEHELNVKSDVVDVLRRLAAIIDSKSTDIRIEIQKQIDERKIFEARLEEASREPGRKEIIEEFKALVSSFPNEMGSMQGHLRRYKETASDVHSLRADVQSLSGIHDKKVNECQFLSSKSKCQVAEIWELRAMVQDLEESYAELKLILEMYRRDSREIQEARDLEYEAWASVQSLKSSLDEHSLELRVKTANEAEARSQQRLAAAEAEIANMIHKLEASKREILRLTDVLKSKNEENEAYLSEIETIGQAYDDMQTQNQHLLQQITERDDYNIKLLLEGVRARQLQDALFMDKRALEREIQQANLSLNFFDMKVVRIEDQLKVCSDHIQKLQEDKFQSSMTFASVEKRMLDVKGASQQAQESMNELQSKVNIDRKALLELHVELERKRFEKRRMEEELNLLRRKISQLRTQTEGLSIIEKLQQELGEYREILKCNICLDRTKQVVITKCYHLFCHPCVQKIIETRHRKCPTCSTAFGPNDVKSVYI